jgi:hypothetical protein
VLTHHHIPQFPAICGNASHARSSYIYPRMCPSKTPDRGCQVDFEAIAYPKLKKWARLTIADRHTDDGATAAGPVS